MNEKDAKPPRLSIGVYTIYNSQEKDELIHLLTFFKNHYKWNKKTLAEDLTVTNPDHPLAQENLEFITLKALVHKMFTGGEIPNFIAIGFCDKHQLLFRKYLLYLEREMDPEFGKTKTAFQDAENRFFPKRHLAH
jgi:hypothetical protein